MRLWVGAFLLVLTALAQEPRVFDLKGDLTPIHDPVMIREGGTYYVFATNRFQGKDTPMFCSQDLENWKFCGNVFPGVPEWAQKEIPGTRGMWAPDISFARGEYRLYYSISTFGSPVSAIGLVTNKTLDPNSPNYKWVDQGKVLGSKKEDDWNAIDPNLAVDESGGMWLSWGSFWSGIKMRKIDPASGKLATDDTNLYSLASRKPMQPPAIEAPFIVRKNGYYYLFVSFDRCCRGKDSTYNIVVGRSQKITGPYVDRDGKPMMEGGGTLVLAGNEAWKGPGHNAVVMERDRDLLVFHAYHGETGRSYLMISTMTWEDGWPQAGKLPTTLPASAPLPGRGN